MTFTSNDTKLVGQSLVQEQLIMVAGTIEGSLTRYNTLLGAKQTIEARPIDSDIERVKHPNF